MTDHDVLVIGAGIVGVSIALRLAQRGQRVAIIEREIAAATGSTGRSAAGVRVQFSEPVNVALSAASIAEYRAMPESGYIPAGYLFLVPQRDWNAQCDAVRMQRSLGHDVQLLDPVQAARIVAFDADGIAGATWCPTDGFVDPHGITLSWLAQARALGVATLFGQPVQAIEAVGGHWQLATPEHQLRAPVVVNAAGAWSGVVAGLAGLQVPVAPARRVVFASAPRPTAAPLPMTIDLGSGLWFRSEQQRLIFGLANEADHGFAEGVDWEWLESVYPAAQQRFPWFETLSLDRRASWWGYYEVTPDHQPIFGPMPGAPGWFNCCGFSGHGVQQAAAAGRIVAAEVLGESPFIDVSTLRIERFTAASGDARSGGEAAGHRAERLIV